MYPFQFFISISAVLLTFIGYIPYIRDIFRGKTKPHAFTWFIWMLAGSIAYSLQVLGGAGVGSWALLAACSVCAAIFLLSLWIGDRDVTRSDVIFLLLALVAIFFWLVIKQPMWSVILATVIEILGFIPTVRKSWNKPYSETLVTYEVSAFRHGISILALQRFNILTVLYPLSWTITNVVFVVILVVRRRQNRKKS